MAFDQGKLVDMPGDWRIQSRQIPASHPACQGDVRNQAAVMTRKRKVGIRQGLR
jgi:hypothetical protein